jgi:hypothetical protein
VFQKTSNPYKFKYLITGITGPGIEEVYLPELPPNSKIHYAKQQRWIRPEMSDDLKRWVKEWRRELEHNPKAIHGQHEKIQEWEDQQWERCRPGGKGFWFWNGYDDEGGEKKQPELVWLTPFHYWYLTEWQPYFGRPDFRDSDKEIFYWMQYWEEDPNSYGGAMNTIRRYAKSTIMSAWSVWRTIMNYRHNTGMQGETDAKIKKFYKKMVLKPFYKLPYYFQPTYNTDTKQTTSIEFDLPPQRSKKRSQTESDDIETLESMIDFRNSGEGEYDGDILNSYIMEEPGKLIKVDLYNDEGEGRWDIVKPCFLQGEEICGKAFLGTTVDYLQIADKGGKQYKKLFMDSDYNQKQEDGRTISGLYAAFLPGDCALKGYYDTHGRPKRFEARESLMRTRKSYRRNPRKLAGWIRKYPMTIQEVFYVSPDRCEFNAGVLQDRLMEIDSSPTPFTSRIDLYWENGVRFSKVKWRHNEQGWLQVANIPEENDQNKVGTRKDVVEGKLVERRYPKNDIKFASGIDPIQFGSSGSGRESRPVQFIKRKYDSGIDGPYPTDEKELEQRALDKFAYKTNRYVAMMDHRPTNPLVLAERVLMVCWFFGCSVNVEKQMGALIMSYFHEHGCGDFILHKYKPEFEKKDRNPTDGTAASTTAIQEYTGENAYYIDYFGHTIPFKELITDALVYDASNTQEHDYTVAMGWTELACKMKPKVVDKPVQKITDFLPTFDQYGNALN